MSEFGEKLLTLLKRLFLPGALVLLLLVFQPLSSFVGQPVAFTYKEFAKRHLASMPWFAPFVAQGTFTVEVLEQGSWKRAGEIQADQHYRIQTLTLPTENMPWPLRVRLTQQGGGAAHLDSVLLDGTPPQSVAGGSLDKLKARDYDVIDVFGKSVELSFARPGGGALGSGHKLTVTARIEPKQISQEPFQFPLANMYRTMGPDSEFFEYRLGTHIGRLTPDGDIAREALPKPFFEAYYPVASGHPQAPVVGWVMNDHDNLYVAIDFLSDNTRDGGKDYTKVYINTPDGLRMFKNSTGDRRWGNPGFGYTGRVAYEHKEL